MTDSFNDPTVKRWAEHVVTDLVPKIESSQVCVSLLPPGEGDVKFWVELGAMICMNKPIIAVAIGDRPIPPKLELIADEVVYLPEGVNLAGSEALAEAIARWAD